MGIFDKGVKKTNMNFFQKLGRAIVGKSKVDDDVLDALEEALLSSDMGVDTTLKVIENLEDRVEKDKYVSMDECSIEIGASWLPGDLGTVKQSFYSCLKDSFAE